MNGDHEASDERRYSAGNLTRLAEHLLSRGGSLPPEAACVAENLVGANLTGHDSHGIGMLPRYLSSLLSGGLRPNVHARVEVDAGALLRLGGGLGYGQVVGREAMALGISRARDHGTCVIALHHAHHLGRIGWFAEQCLVAGLVSVHFVNVVVRPIVAAFGGLDPRSGTNPVCIGIPRRDGSALLLDFATSRIAQGKARVAYNRGQPVPEGMLLDDRGQPSTDPRYAIVPPLGALLPFGDHKGFGLSVVAELLGGALTGGPTCHDPHTGNQQILNGMFSILIDARRLQTSDHFEREATAYLAWLRDSRVPRGAGRVMMPGEPERAARRARSREGIGLDEGTWRELVEAAARVGVDPEQCAELAGAAG